jgi:hypothetical protein
VKARDQWMAEQSSVTMVLRHSIATYVETLRFVSWVEGEKP